MLLDTNAYSGLALGKQSVVDVVGEALELKLPLPVIAELRYGFAKGNKAEHNEQILQSFLAQAQVTIAFPSLETTKYYAQLQLYCMQSGKVLSQNDLWIAALAQEISDKLVTFDKDFEVLLDLLGDKLIILES